ncbi:MAG: GNAT family N-acetyltransferase [Clostridia bacterium]|nr:GNAT family N-acetyltransferase [Clostridia bacterium]
MSIKLRQYTKEAGFTEDFIKVRDFLKRIYQPGYQYGNWLWNRWEWMFSLPYLDETKLSKIGLWESDGEIVALATYEMLLGDAWFSMAPEFGCLKRELAEYAFEYLSKTDEHGNRSLNMNIDDKDKEFREIALDLGFQETKDLEQTAEFIIPGQFSEVSLPEGYSIVSLSEENDLNKINRVLWRGFNHPGEVPDEEIQGRIKSQSGPDFNKDITMAVKAPNGNFVSYSGMWYDPNTDYAIVEPVATDPDYRRMGLGKAVVLEGIRRCGEMGGKVAYVGSGQQFYYAIGFKPLLENRWWKKAE